MEYAKAYAEKAYESPEAGYVEGGNSIGRSVERLEKYVAILADRMNDLQSRLEMVSRPITPHPVNARDDGPALSEVASPLVGSLSDLGRRIDAVTRQMQAQIDRLEL